MQYMKTKCCGSMVQSQGVASASLRVAEVSIYVCSHHFGSEEHQNKPPTRWCDLCSGKVTDFQRTKFDYCPTCGQLTNPSTTGYAKL
jgi:hypothetical protein